MTTHWKRGRSPAACPVCRAPTPEPFLSVDDRNYWRCLRCEARFLDGGHFISSDEERNHYLTHENDPADPRYRSFLSKLSVPLLARLVPGQAGLDYGCGAGSALAALLREAGHAVELYDPFFHPDFAALEQRYDFVTCTETAEHFHRPADEFEKIAQLLKPGGWLAVMTCFQTDDSRFAAWHYRKDPTHVVFYRAETMQHIAAMQGWTCEIPVKDVALFRCRPSFRPSRESLSHR